MNIRLKLTLWYCFILTVTLLAFNGIVYWGVNRSLLETVDNHLQREYHQVLNGLEFEDDYDEYPSGIEMEYIPEVGVLWQIVDTNGREVIGQAHFDGVTFTTDPLRPRQFGYATLNDGTPIRIYTSPLVQGETFAGFIIVGESYDELRRLQQELLTWLTGSVPLVLLVASVAGWFLARHALQPIDRITRMAQRITATQLDQRLTLDLPDDEVGRLARTFDAMLDRLQATFEQQKRLIADTSHELKTPLTILKGEIEVTLNRPRPAEVYRHTLEMTNQTVDRLTDLINTLLLLARADNNQYTLQRTEFDLTDLLTEQLSQLQPTLDEKALTPHLDLPTPCLIQADRKLLARASFNLLDNAIKYTQPHTRIIATGQRQNGHFRLTIQDEGSGIAAEHLPHLFDRFYRVDKARGRGGAGLGLSIVKWVVTIHGGRVTVESHIGQGTQFTLHLPVSE